MLWKTKEKLFLWYVRLIVIYACKTWSTIMSDENQLLYFERKVLRMIYGLIRNSITGQYKRRENVDLENMYNKSSIKNMLYVKRFEWAGYT